MRKNITIYKKIFAILTILVTTNAFSQNGQDVEDMETWVSIGVKYKLNKKWAFGISEQLRLKEDASTVDSYFTQFEANYNVTKKISLGGGIRYISKNDNTGNVQGNKDYLRFQVDASYRYKVSDFLFKYRLRYQNKNELGVSISEGDYANQNIRLKAGVGYNIKNWKLDPKFSGEIFNHFEKGKESGFNKFRLTFGTNYSFKSLGEIGLFYRFEKELNVNNPKKTNIIGLKYVYTIKNKRNKNP